MAGVLVILADGFEEIEAVAVIDVLRRADIKVVAAGVKDGPITSARGVRIIPDAALYAVRALDYDMVVLPGGMPGTDNLAKDERVKKAVREMYEAGKYTAAICAAPYVLSEAGILSDKKATSHPTFQQKLNAASVSESERVVVDGKVITSQGAGTAIEFALQLVEILVSKERAEAISLAMVCAAKSVAKHKKA
ncbi:MAG: DJ-1/PfpI family protein [Nitrospirae bacterium]|nr:DJ-1/PfpI family protein [Nitrospirota bacterium]